MMKPLNPFSPGLRLQPDQPTYIQSVEEVKPTMTFSPPSESVGIDIASAFALLAFSLAIVKHVRR